MPPVVVGAAVSAAASTAVGYFTTTIAASAIVSSFATSFAISLAGSVALSALSGKPSGSFGAQGQGVLNRDQMVKQAITNRRVIYGTSKVSGPLVYMETTENNKYLHLVIALASHEITNIPWIYIEDDKVSDFDANGFVTSGDYKDKVRVKFHLGASDQTADADLVAESDGDWTNDHRLQGIAYIYVRLEFDQDVFPNGIPNVSALVNGKKVYDVRDTTTHFSTNPALCLRDYLLDTNYGLGVSSSEINDTSFIAAANECDELVNLNGEEVDFRVGVGVGKVPYTEEFTVGGFTFTSQAAQGISSANNANQTVENRYTMNGTFDTNETPKSIIENILTSLGGTFTYTAGEFSLKAASYITPSDTLTQDDLRSGVSVKSKESRRDQFNAVKGVFVYSAENYKPTDYPSITSSTFVAEDNNETVFANIDFPYTVSPSMAQRLAKIALYSNREQLSLVFPCNLSAFKYQVGDTVMVNLDRYGFSSKVFEVAKWSLALDQDDNGQPVMGVDLLLKETSSAVYDWNAEETTFSLNNTTLFDAKTVAAPGLTVTDELRIVNEEAVSVLLAEVTSSNNAVSQFEVQAKKATDTNYVSMGKGGTGRYELLNVEDGAVYDVRARALNALNVRSPFTTDAHQVVGKTEPPADVTNFQVNVIGTEAHLSWTPVADLDLSHYIIRHSPLTSGAIFTNATTLVDKVSRPANTVTVPALTGTYFVRSVDKLGLASANATSNVTLIDDIKDLNLVATSTQHPSFTGTKTDVYDIGSALVLDTALFDDVTGDFDDAVGKFDGGGGTVSSEGIYDFDTYIDTGGVYTSRITATVLSERLDYVDLFDDATGLFDDREGFFDGDNATFGDVNVELQIARTRDDPTTGSPTYTAFQKFNVGDYIGRGFKFRAVLKSADLTATPKVTQLSVTVDMPDRVYSEKDIASGTDINGKDVTFTPAFKEISGIGISASNLTSGDYYVITNKSATGFTIEFFNSSNATVDRTFDYVVRGYGELAA